MTALPGDDAAITSGRITAEPFIEEDRHTCIVRLHDVVELPILARALAQSGLASVFYALGTMSPADERCPGILARLQSERLVKDALAVTITADAAEQLRDDLDTASLSPELCWRCRVNYATDRRLCPPCGDAEDENDARGAA